VKYNNSYIFSDKYYDINKDIIGIKFSIYNWDESELYYNKLGNINYNYFYEFIFTIFNEKEYNKRKKEIRKFITKKDTFERNVNNDVVDCYKVLFLNLKEYYDNVLSIPKIRKYKLKLLNL
jgi:hypothetical protein